MSSKILLFIFSLSIILLLLDEEETTNRLFVTADNIFVIDGDTIAVGDVRHRLMGFDTPETYRARCEEEHALGTKATQRVEELIAEARGLTLASEPRPDKYGRTLSKAYVSDDPLADILISEGLARTYHGGKRVNWCAILQGSDA